MSRVKITITVPIDYADAVRRALGDAGAGVLGNYSHCSFSTRGVGRFMPQDGAQPFIGAVGGYEAVEEERVEVICEQDNAKFVIAAMKAAHPYEEVAVDVVAIIEEDQL